MKKDLKSSTLSAASWNFTKIMVGQFRNFVVSTILARLLFPEDFGLLGLAMVFASLTDSFVDFGFGNAIIQKQRVNKTQLSTVFWINMMMATLLGLAMFFSASWVAVYFDMPQLKPLTQLMSLTFLIKGLSTLQNALFQKKLDFKTPFKVELVSGFLSGGVGIYLAYTGFGVYSLIYSQITGWIIGTLLIWYFSTWKPSFLFDLTQVKELWNFGYKYSLSVFIDSVFNKLDTIIIGKLFSASILGLFYKAQSLDNLVFTLSFSSISGVLFPSFSKIGDDNKRLRAALIKVLHVVCFTTFLFSGLAVINAKSIIVILFTEKWLGSVPIFQILGLFTFIHTLPTILATPVLSIGESGANLKVEMSKKALYLLAIPVAIYYGLYAYIIATIVAAILGMYFNLVLLKRFFEFKIGSFIKLFLTYFVPFILFMVIEFLMPEMEINHFLLIAIKSSIYILCYFLINIVSKTKGLFEFISLLKILKNTYLERKKN